MKRLAEERAARGRAGEFRVASELCRRKIFAALTMGNIPHVDILCSDSDAKAAICIQVKTFRAHEKTCFVGEKAEKDYGPNFIWVLAGLRDEDHDSCEEAFYIIPSNVMAVNVAKMHKKWVASSGKNGNAHDEKCGVRKVRIGHVGKNDVFMFDVRDYKNKWTEITDALKANKPMRRRRGK